MHFSILVTTSFMALAVARPPAYKSPDFQRSVEQRDGTSTIVNDAAKRSAEKINLLDGTSLTVSDNPTKRSPKDIQLYDGTWLTVSDIKDDDPILTKREDDKISSCGPKSGWTPVADHGLHLDLPMWGYESAVAAFCSRAAWGLNVNGDASPVVVAAGQRIQYTVRWHDDTPGIKDNLRGNRVGLKNDQPGHVDFEVRNKRDKGDYVINEADCKTYLLKMSKPGQDCYGSNNSDSKGGTWQMEDNHLTFHALPASDPADKNIKHDELRRI